MVAVAAVMLVEMPLDDPEIAAVRAEEEIGDRADPRDQAEQEIDADIARHSAICHFDMPRLRASHTM